MFALVLCVALVLFSSLPCLRHRVLQVVLYWAHSATLLNQAVPNTLGVSYRRLLLVLLHLQCSRARATRVGLELQACSLEPGASRRSVLLYNRPPMNCRWVRPKGCLLSVWEQASSAVREHPFWSLLILGGVQCSEEHSFFVRISDPMGQTTHIFSGVLICRPCVARLSPWVWITHPPGKMQTPFSTGQWTS